MPLPPRDPDRSGTASGDLAELLAGAAVDVAPRLLGARLAVVRDGRTVAVRIVEVEAYDQDDPASHTFRGRTSRNAVMFGPPGHLYVYRSHGIHLCANIACEPAGRGAAVLVRGGVVTAGRSTAVDRRGGRDADAWLAAGPGRLTQALGVRATDDGAWLLGDGPVRLEVASPPSPWPGGVIRRGPRVGVTQAPDRAWRFWLDGVVGVSSYRRSPRAPDPVADPVADPGADPGVDPRTDDRTPPAAVVDRDQTGRGRGTYHG